MAKILENSEVRHKIHVFEIAALGYLFQV